MITTDTKQQVLRIIETLPENVTVDEIMEELYFKIQVDTGLKELDAGLGIPHEEVKKRFSTWIAK